MIMEEKKQYRFHLFEHLVAKYLFGVFLPSARGSSETGAKRGCAVLVDREHVGIVAEAVTLFTRYRKSGGQPLSGVRSAEA